MRRSDGHMPNQLVCIIASFFRLTVSAPPLYSEAADHLMICSSSSFTD